MRAIRAARLLTLCLVVSTARPGLAFHNLSAADDDQFFETRIRPLLVEKCLSCHGTDTKQQGSLSLDSRVGWERGGDSGPAITSGDPATSLLLQRVTSTDADVRMPPADAGERLTEQQINDLTEWIRSGAHDPRTITPDGGNEKSWDQLFEERSQWWSLQPVVNHEPPAVTDPDWSGTTLDRFLKARMDAAGVEPSPETDPATFSRRASLILTGLPLSASVSRARWSQPKTAADRAQLIELLVESPHFGERFARHWLDVVRFTETHGNEWNYDVPQAWRYRDYVIRRFNDDVRYDNFVREHIAGDTLLGTYPEGTDPPIIGTAFYRFGEVNHDSCVQFGIIGYDIADNQVDTLTKSFQAMTVACARCHDHKMDAISTRDYHALLGVIRSTRSVMSTVDSNQPAEMVSVESAKSDARAELASVWRREAAEITAARLDQVAPSATSSPASTRNPADIWQALAQSVPESLATTWASVTTSHADSLNAAAEFNRTSFTPLADFRTGIPDGWSRHGDGLRYGVGRGGDFALTRDGDAIIRNILPAGLFTFAVSDRLNGALRSPTLKRTHGKISFEVLGGRFSLARLVFNNCQLNYNHQHSIHHDDWSWITIDFPENTDSLQPYAELLTFRDNPKFPDPLGTLGKDVENQREPFDVHAADPRTWWGLRRVVMHDSAETPRDEPAYLSHLLVGEPPTSKDEAAARFATVAVEVVEAFAADRATDNDVRWLNWLLKTGLLSNNARTSPGLQDVLTAYRAAEQRLSNPVTIPAMADEGDAFDQPLFERGDYTKPGELIPRGYVKVLIPGGQLDVRSGSGRREVAELIASPDNPLTARVIVNRVWQWVFGTGLVATPDDFGHLGQRPSHPELLDHLTAEFINDHWSIKRLVRRLVLSRAFRSAAAPTESARRIDPDNRLLSHFSSRRAEAEVIRDSLLAISGRLDSAMFGPSIHPYRTTADTEKRLYTGPLDGNGRRSIYLKYQLMEAPHFLRSFNLPGGKVTQGRRDTSNTPAQSLAMLNDPLVLSLAEHWSARLVTDGCTSIDARITSMFQRAFSRDPSTEELAGFTDAINRFAEERQIPTTHFLTSQPLWTDAAHLLFNMKELIFVP